MKIVTVVSILIVSGGVPVDEALQACRVLVRVLQGTLFVLCALRFCRRAIFGSSRTPKKAEGGRHSETTTLDLKLMTIVRCGEIWW